MTILRMSSNWVDGDQFFDRETDLQLLRERMANGTHTLLTAQRRMGKTSLVRELLRQLEEEGEVATVFVDLEGSMDAAEAVAEMATQARSVQRVGGRIMSWLSGSFRDVRNNVEELGVSEVRVRLRDRLNAGNWQRTGDQVFEALASNERPVVLAIDELPILVNRLLKGHEYRITPERLAATDSFMAWLRRCCQTHQGRVCLIVSGSVGLEPVLSQAKLSAHANIYSALDLKPWTHDTAVECLAALARGHEISLSEDVRYEMCRRLRCCVPHHVQRFFHHLHEHLLRDQRNEATLDDVELVYWDDLLGARGQADMLHYEDRLVMVLGEHGSAIARGLLTDAASSDGLLEYSMVDVHQEVGTSVDGGNPVDDVLHVLVHDGYMERLRDGYGFVSGLLEDWWRIKYVRGSTSTGRR